MSNISGRMRDSSIAVRDKSISYLDSYMPPSRRQEYQDSIRSWAAVNPKLAAFFGAQLLLSGPPILLFLGFSITVLISSFLVCLLTALTATFAFTALCTGLALLVLLPTLLVTSIVATFLFMSGLITGAAVSRFNNDPRTEGLRKRTKSNAAAVSDKVKDASNGTIDFQAATEELSKKMFESSPHDTDETVRNQRAREYLARQALGIPEKYESPANGNAQLQQQPATDLNSAVSHTNDSYVQPSAKPKGTREHLSQAYQDYTAKPQAV